MLIGAFTTKNVIINLISQNMLQKRLMLKQSLSHEMYGVMVSVFDGFGGD